MKNGRNANKAVPKEEQPKPRPMSELRAIWEKNGGQWSEHIEKTISEIQSLASSPNIHNRQPLPIATVRHVSRSGMLRYIGLSLLMPSYVAKERGEIINLAFYIHYLTSHKRGGLNSNYPDCIKAEGCGMDMIFAILYDLSRTLFTTPSGATLPLTSYHYLG